MCAQDLVQIGSEILRGVVSPPQTQRKIAMLHEGRCGSTVLGDLLNQHPLIDWEGEIFQHRRSEICRRLQLEYPMAYIKWRRLRSEKSFYGFETKTIDHLNLMGLSLPEYTRRLKDIGVSSFIYLDRRNNLRRTVSKIVGRKRVFHLSASAPAPEPARVRVDVNSVPLKGGARATSGVAAHLRAYF